MHFLFIGHRSDCEISNVIKLIFLDFQICLLIWYQIYHGLLVDFKHRARNNHFTIESLCFIVWHYFYGRENILNSWRYNALLCLMSNLSKHSVSFSTSSLSICKYSGIKTSYKIFDHLFTYGVINFTLLRIRLKDTIIWKKVILTEYFLFINDCNFLVRAYLCKPILIYISS